MNEATAANAAPKAPGTDAKGEPMKPKVATTDRGRSGQKVTVACCVPNGLVLRVHEWTEDYTPVFGGGVKLEKVSRPTGIQVLINGPARPFGVIPGYMIVGGFALTDNVDAEVWDAWARDNAKSELLTRMQISAHASHERAHAWAMEHARVRSGLEAINAGTIKDAKGREVPADPRMPRGTPNLSGTTTEALPA